MDEAKKNKTEIREPESFEARMMRVDPKAGKKRPTTWERSRHKRFNAHGCQ